MTGKCLSDSEVQSNEILVCRVIGRKNSEEFVEMKKSLGKFADDVWLPKKINVLQAENNQLYLIVDENRDTTLEDFTGAVREIIWFCEDMDTYKISVKGMDRVKLPEDCLKQIIENECGKYNIHIM